jgi:hypothetical protein
MARRTIGERRCRIDGTFIAMVQRCSVSCCSAAAAFTTPSSRSSAPGIPAAAFAGEASAGSAGDGSAGQVSDAGITEAGFLLGQLDEVRVSTFLKTMDAPQPAP